MFPKPKTTAPIQEAINKNSSDRIPIRDIMIAMDSGGFGLVLAFFSLSAIIPLPPPLPSLLSIPLLIFSWQMMLGYKSPHLPRKISRKTIKRSVLAGIIEKSAKSFHHIEKLLKPRLRFLTRGISERIIGFFTFIFSVSILVPFPFTNLIPGIGILIISLGLVGKDGLMIILGALIGIAGISIAIAAFILGVEFLGAIHHFITS